MTLNFKISLSLQKDQHAVLMSGHQISFHLSLYAITRGKRPLCASCCTEGYKPGNSNNSTSFPHNSGGQKSQLKDTQQPPCPFQILREDAALPLPHNSSCSLVSHHTTPAPQAILAGRILGSPYALVKTPAMSFKAKSNPVTLHLN